MCQFNHRNQEDVALFDFTSIHAANCAARARRRNGKDLIMCLAGDSLLEVSKHVLCIVNGHNTLDKQYFNTIPKFY